MRRGVVACAPGSVKSHKAIKAQVYVLTKREGGRHKPFVSNYSSMLFTSTVNIHNCLKVSVRCSRSSLQILSESKLLALIYVIVGVK